MFGRNKVPDEDPFAALKEGGVYESTPTTTVAGIPGSGFDEQPTVVPGSSPVPVAPATASPTATVPGQAPSPVSAPGPVTTRPRRNVRVTRYGMRRATGPGQFVLWLVILGVIAGIAIPIISSASHGIRSFSIPSFSVPAPSIPSFSTPTPRPPKPHVTTNYLHPAVARAGLRRIARRFPGARVTNLRIDGTSMDALVYTTGGGVKDLTMNSSGTFVSSSSGAGEQPIAISAIPPSAVGRIVRAMRSRFHVPAGRIDYMVLTTIPNAPPRWITFPKAPSRQAYAASLDGSDLQELGG